MNKTAPFWYVISVDNIKFGEIRSIDFWGRNMILWKDTKGDYILQSKYCTHLGVDLSKGKIVNGKIECPFHGYKFDHSGKSNQCIPNIRNYHVIAYAGLVWFYNGNNPTYQIQNFFIDNGIEIDDSKSYFINTYKKSYELPTRFLGSNFYDLAHFSKVHGVRIQSSRIIDEGTYLIYDFHGEYQPNYFLQRILFWIIPNRIYSKVIYSKNCMYSLHRLLSKSGKILFEYAGVFPSTPINKTETLIISTIIVKKGLLGWISRLLGKGILTKATNDEFDMLTGMNPRMSNFTPNDILLRKYLKFYDEEYLLHDEGALLERDIN